MGVSMSITKYAKYNDPNYPDGQGPGQGQGQGQGQGEGQDEEKKCEPIEPTAENIDKIKQENFDKWSKIFRDLTRNEEIENKIKSSFKKLFIKKYKLEENEQSTEEKGQEEQKGGEGENKEETKEENKEDINDIKFFINKIKIVAEKDDVFKYMGGDDKYSFFLKEDIDKYWLVDEKVKELLNEEVAAAIIEVGKNEKDFKKNNKEKYEEVSTIITKITSDLVPIMFDKTQIATQRLALKKVIEHVVKSDKFKDYHKTQNISGNKDAITSGELSSKEAALKRKEEEEEKKEIEKIKQNAGDNSEGGYSSSSSYGSGGYSSSSGGYSSEGGDDYDGGKSTKEKEYKKFKEEERKGFAENIDSFMKDEVKLIAFIDKNVSLLASFYDSGGKKFDKNRAESNQELLKSLFEAINSYEKQMEETGRAVEMIAESAKCGENGESAGTAGADEQVLNDPEAFEELAKKDPEKAKALAQKNPEKVKALATKDPARAQALAQQFGMMGGSQGGGGRNTPTKTKKKRQQKNLPKNINININLGKTNIAFEDTSSSDSSSDSSGSESDDESEDENIIKKGKKQVKYVVNPPKKKNRTKRRQKDYTD